jgi:hypothetical protein
MRECKSNLRSDNFVTPGRILQDNRNLSAVEFSSLYLLTLCYSGFLLNIFLILKESFQVIFDEINIINNMLASKPV